MSRIENVAPQALSVAFLLTVAHLSGNAVAQGCELLGTDANGMNLLALDPTNGTGTVIGTMSGGVFPSLATDPTTGIVYAGTGQGMPLLYTVDPNTGATTLVGDTMLGFAAVSGMAFDAAGTLFAAVNIANNGASGADHLATIDKNTALATVIGPFGTCPFMAPCTIEGMEGITFDGSGSLVGVVTTRGSMFSGAPAGLYSINTTTGAATFLRPLLDPFGMPASGGFTSIEYCSCNGAYFGGTATEFSPGAGDGGRLAVIDVTGGIFVYLGTTSATPNARSLGGLALRLRAAGSVTRNGSGVNPTALSETAPAAIGGTWQATVALAPGASVSFLGYSLAGPAVSPMAFGELLVATPILSVDIATGSHTLPIPNNCSFVGITVFTQGGMALPLQLTNALDFTVGYY